MEPKDEDYGQFEEIVIVDVFDENEDTVRTVNVEFTQESTIKGIKRSFVIFNDCQLLQSLRSFRHKDDRQYRINLRYIDPEPVRDCRYEWRILAASGVCLCLAVLLSCIWYFSRFDSSYLLMTATLFAAGSVIALLLFFYKSHDTFIYRSLAAGVPLIVLDNRKPGLQEFDTFLHKLEQYTRAAQKCNMSKQQFLAGELKDLRRLKDDGMLTDQIYEEARTRIFRHKDYSALK
jgi:hypothetical protein